MSVLNIALFIILNIECGSSSLKGLLKSWSPADTGSSGKSQMTLKRKRVDIWFMHIPYRD